MHVVHATNVDISHKPYGHSFMRSPDMLESQFTVPYASAIPCAMTLLILQLLGACGFLAISAGEIGRQRVSQLASMKMRRSYANL